jgi:predicted Fe-Mo cluster-binding NifX family protein
LTLVDSESGAIEVVVNRGAHHVPGTCETATSLPSRGVGAVVCLGLGRRAFGALQRLGVGVFVTDQAFAGGAASAFRDGRVRPLAGAEACGGGRSDGRHHHHHHRQA